VQGDVISLNVGNIVPADGEIIEAKNLSINESALTGESLPKEKAPKDTVYSGSFINTGAATIKVIAAGKNTYFGKTIVSVDRIRKQSLLERDIITISKSLSVLSLISVLALSIALFTKQSPLIEVLTLDLSLVIAGIPISLPTIMTLIIELGVLNLAKKDVIVRRLSALEDLANVNLLLIDKTGTLTLNKISVQKEILHNKFTARDLMEYFYVAEKTDEANPIFKAAQDKLSSLNTIQPRIDILDFIPPDSIRKRSTVIAKIEEERILISCGAPQIIKNLCSLSKNDSSSFDKEVLGLAKEGYRTLAISIRKEQRKEENMLLVGLLGLSDTIREEAKDVIKFMRLNNIDTIMLTGDNKEITKEVAKSLRINSGNVLAGSSIKEAFNNITKDTFSKIGAFSEILPADKLNIVTKAKEFFITAVTGDGVNDLPAIKEAHVGIAVRNAVDALKSTADIVLISSGIAVIKDAIIESRKIFSRVYSYSIYRISESLRLIITIAILGIIYEKYPLTALQIILIALLNDLPIISLAFDRVKITSRPAKIDPRKRLAFGSVFGTVGILNSLILFFILTRIIKLDSGMVQTIYFLKLTVSGHLLIYVARTEDLWFKFLPSKEVILATSITQAIATILAITGFFMPSSIGSISFNRI